MEKKFLTYNMEVNGLVQEVRFSEAAVEKIFMPLLHELTDLKLTLDRKVIAYLVAPPGSGKSTLAQFLEWLSRERSEVDNIRALGMDSFHYSAAYMKVTEVERDGEKILMQKIKGAPETFDVDTLVEKIREVRQEGTDWNIYDRKIHDVLPDYMSVEDDIILIEGNYLLLDEPAWTNVRVLADYSVFIDADANLLKERIVGRKILGGSSREEAEKFFEYSDAKNIERILNHSARADETWKLLPDGDFEKQ
ncbi:MAG: nucleoside/nucleotide kinase family protein [Selenomonadaceae bacterium]|nr:nucleoside/nucleotide kinase family protein [Selenomonadaceae bacterium]